MTKDKFQIAKYEACFKYDGDNHADADHNELAFLAGADWAREWCEQNRATPMGLHMQITDLMGENAKLREALETLAAQGSDNPKSIRKSDCMAALAKAALGDGK